jgi:prepilin-type N-terminal cleavage/methylation domain-containing protein
MNATAARRQQGFTLIEIIISIVIVGILSAFGVTMISSNMRTALMVDSGQASLDRARYALDRAAREMREVKFNTDGTYSISSTLAAGATSMTFVRTISGSDVTITLARSGSNVTLQYSSPAATSTLVSGVTSLSLNFYDGTGVATTSTSNVRFVAITMVVTDSTSGQSVSQRTQVALRNG